MSIYPAPKEHNGSLNTVFNRDDYDYVQTSNSSSGTTQAQNDSRYLRNSGIVVSSGATTFNNSVDIEGLATLNNLEVSSLFKSKQFTDSLNIATFSSQLSFSFNNGLVYYLDINSTTITSISFTDIPETQQQTYIFTFIMKPASYSSYNPAYLQVSSNTVAINGQSTSLFGLSNVTFPSSYTYIIQQITLINMSTTANPNFISLTSLSAY
jgi:hypothetical protein